MFNLFYLFPFVSIVSVSHFYSCLILLKTVSYFLSQACRRNFLYLILFIISFIFSNQIYRSLIDIFLDSFFYLVLFYINSLSHSLSERFFSLSYYLLNSFTLSHSFLVSFFYLILNQIRKFSPSHSLLDSFSVSS